MSPARRSRRRYLALLAAACLGVGVLAFSASNDGMTYYRTPTEARGQIVAQDTMRLGGLVLPGSMEQSDEVSTMRLSDGATDITVHYPGRMPALVQEGEGAVVHGAFDADGVFQAEEILLRHSNEYRAPSEADEIPAEGYG